MLNKIKWFYHSAWAKYHWLMEDSVNPEEDYLNARQHHKKRAQYHERKAVKAAWGM